MNDFLSKQRINDSPSNIKQSKVGETSCCSHDEISKRAYEIYIQKGQIKGQCRQNWIEAQEQLRYEKTHANPPEYSRASTSPYDEFQPLDRTTVDIMPSGRSGGRSTSKMNGPEAARDDHNLRS